MSPKKTSGTHSNSVNIMRKLSEIFNSPSDWAKKTIGDGHGARCILGGCSAIVDRKCWPSDIVNDDDRKKVATLVYALTELIINDENRVRHLLAGRFDSLDKAEEEIQQKDDLRFASCETVIYRWNDSQTVTFEDVQALIKELETKHPELYADEVGST